MITNIKRNNINYEVVKLIMKWKNNDLAKGGAFFNNLNQSTSANMPVHNWLIYANEHELVQFKELIKIIGSSTFPLIAMIIADAQNEQIDFKDCQIDKKGRSLVVRSSANLDKQFNEMINQKYSQQLQYFSYKTLLNKAVLLFVRKYYSFFKSNNKGKYLNVDVLSNLFTIINQQNNTISETKLLANLNQPTKYQLAYGEDFVTYCQQKHYQINASFNNAYLIYFYLQNHEQLMNAVSDLYKRRPNLQAISGKTKKVIHSSNIIINQNIIDTYRNIAHKLNIPIVQVLLLITLTGMNNANDVH